MRREVAPCGMLKIAIVPTKRGRREGREDRNTGGNCCKTAVLLSAISLKEV